MEGCNNPSRRCCNDTKQINAITNKESNGRQFYPQGPAVLVLFQCKKDRGFQHCILCNGEFIVLNHKRWQRVLEQWGKVS